MEEENNEAEMGLSSIEGWKRLFGHNLRQARYGRRLSQNELSNRVEVPQQDISQMENGNRNVTLSMVLRLSKAIGISPITLLSPDNSVSAQSRSRRLPIALKDLDKEVLGK